MRDSGKWIVIGSSPSAAVAYERAKREHPRPDQTITTNSGIKLKPTPTFYFAHDLFATYELLQRIRQAESFGTKIIIRLRLIKFQKKPIKIRFAWTTWKHNTLRYVPGAYVHCGLSGWICTQFALNHGADHIVWVGMEGYRSTDDRPVVDTFDGRLGHGRAGHVTQWSYGVLMQSAIDVCPEVRFTFYGEPAYPLHGPNLDIVPAEEPLDVETECSHPIVQ